MLEEHIRGTSNVIRGSCCYKWALVNHVEKVCVGAADYQCLTALRPDKVGVLKASGGQPRNLAVLAGCQACLV